MPAIPAEFKTLYDFMRLKVKNEKTGKEEDG
jgi:hypothetical protein